MQNARDKATLGAPHADHMQASTSQIAHTYSTPVQEAVGHRSLGSDCVFSTTNNSQSRSPGLIIPGTSTERL